MSKKGIDVSSYQGNIDWNKVKSDGIEFAILKVIRKDLNPDKQFENNWKGCTESGIPIQGVYNYSYATHVGKSIADARQVVRILNGRKTMVWLDAEDNCQKNLGAKLISVINAYAEVITGAGLDFGVYTGQSFYNTYIKPYGGVKYPLWIARYGKNNGRMEAKYQPQIDGMIGWQYTSRGSVIGIKGNVDMNVWYKELSALNNPTETNRGNPYKEPTRLLYKKAVSMRGEDVKWLQWYLVHHNCLPAFNRKGKTNIDGIFGKDTDSAVRKFQRSAGIAVDGKAGVVTRKCLKA